jgi:hypothetical protein
MSLLLNSTPGEMSAQHVVDIAVAEAERLVARFDSHEGRNDLVALQLQRAICRQRGAYDCTILELCLKRLRLAAEAKRYPVELR